MFYTAKHIIFRCLAAAAAVVAVTVWPCDAAGKDTKRKSDDTFTVVIDAGHGGKDYGCIGKTANEKTITLDVAKRLRDKLEAEKNTGIHTVMTRDTDKYLTLQERANVANKAEGDLFISIHVNSVDKKSKGRESVKGASVYALGADKAASNLGVAMRENAVIELEDDYTENYRGFDNSTESYIIFELSNDLHLNQSLDFAGMTQRQLVQHAGRADKGVRQAGFWVLWATSMPAVLVELDFICNPQQEKYLNSAEGREQCAEAIFRAVKEYRNHYKRKTKNARTEKK